MAMLKMWEKSHLLCRMAGIDPGSVLTDHGSIPGSSKNLNPKWYPVYIYHLGLGFCLLQVVESMARFFVFVQHSVLSLPWLA